jgi:hypothetical protein
MMPMAPRILFCGDTFLRTRNGEGPLARMRPSFANAAVCLNLETALQGGQIKTKNVPLTVDEAALDQLPEEVRILTIVNNHSADSGAPERLASALQERGKTVVGPQNPAVAELALGGISVDFLSAYFPLPRMRVSYFGRRADVLTRMLAESTAQRKVVNLHWGYEHSDVPAPFQRQLARRLVDVGADLIIGHHPHVPQGEEIFGNRSVYYSLGNFNFWQLDGETREDNRWGYMIDYDLDSNQAKPIPYRINDNFQPFLSSKEETDDLISRLTQLSQSILEVDESTWFRTQYAQWYAREMKVWKRRCGERPASKLWLKWAAWMCIPMQWKYRFHVA